MTDADVARFLFVAFIALCASVVIWLSARSWRARHHTDWRPEPLPPQSTGIRFAMKRWNGEQWEYREATPEEEFNYLQDEAW